MLRENIGGTYYYSGYVNGALLQGTGADGQYWTARVKASRICWNSLDAGSNRRLLWFGETFNEGDSMGGWVGATRNHLDHDPLRYSYNTGWQIPNLPYVNPCNYARPIGDPDHSCTIAERDHIYVDTVDR